MDMGGVGSHFRLPFGAALSFFSGTGVVLLDTGLSHSSLCFWELLIFTVT